VTEHDAVAEREAPPDAAEDQSPPAPRARPSVASIFERHAVVLLLAAMIVLFSVLSQTGGVFRSEANLRALLSNQAVIALVALASIVPLIAGQIDLSVGPVAGLCGLLSAGLSANDGYPALLAIGIGIGVGAIVGLVNGILIAYLNVGAIVATLGTATLIQAIASWYSKDQTIVAGIPRLFISLGAGNIGGIPRTVYYLVGVSALLYYALQQTPFGRHLYYIGENRQAIELLGIPVKAYICGSFIVSGVIGAAAGVLQVAIAGSASPQVGPGFTLPALAAAFLGATTIRPGRFNVVGTLTAIFLVAVIVNGLTLLGAADWMQPAVNGASLLVAVVVGAVARRRRSAA
jgi:ribose transport system permease protein